ncbi:hypothetical protein EUTSA_v10019800mg [Eutrema salsugineum]|uniref:Trafficking protein particle complex subunit n=1 Tax=Eutrema salsugineum TaxID=72664 RepID=V4JPK7_EUTSA|nr:hypothetical protein EUTSA_v10019800mg [Eutrema salsugineum]
MANTACFIIVGRNDIPIYEAEVGSAAKFFNMIEYIPQHTLQLFLFDFRRGEISFSVLRIEREDAAQLHQFILHAALDVVQDLAWTTSAMFSKSVDRFNDLVVSVYDGIKSFFQEVHELYIKSLLNSLYLPGSRITSSHFDTKVRALARKYL